jgi:hypothetical protein
MAAYRSGFGIFGLIATPQVAVVNFLFLIRWWIALNYCSVVACG